MTEKQLTVKVLKNVISALKTALAQVKDGGEGSDSDEGGGLSRSAMRCRYCDKDGNRCRARSKGPRFRFMCEEHKGKDAKPAAKPEPEAKPEAKAS